MLRRMRVIVCVMGAVVAVLAAGALQAGVVVYNANADLMANMAQESPTPVYGVWSFGAKATVTGDLDTADMGVARNYGEGTTAPWGDAFQGASATDPSAVKIVVNSTGAAQDTGWVIPRNDDAMFLIDGATWLPETLPVVRFTAPSAGTATLSGLLKVVSWGTQHVDILHNGTSLHSGAYTCFSGNWDLDGWGAGPRLQNLVAPVVMAGGDTLDVVLGNGDDLWLRSYLSEYVSFDSAGSVTAVAWTGIGGTTWSTDTGLNNWKDGGGTAADYATGAEVTFNDTATGTAIDISAADVFPASVTFNNSSQNFTITGNKGIAGTTGVLKKGTGAVTLNSVNTYTGVTTVQAGTLQMT
jgi:autotransporter-associated beta strand protein